MSAFEFPCEIVMVYTPAIGSTSSRFPIPKVYSSHVVESENHLNTCVESTRVDIDQYRHEVAQRWEKKFGDDWKAQYQESIGCEFDQSFDAQMNIEPMTYEQYDQKVKDTLLTPEVNGLRELTEEAFYDAYEALPPHNQSGGNGYMSFTMSERLTDSITTQYIKCRSEDEYFFASRLVDLSDRDTFITLAEMHEHIDQVKASRDVQSSADPLADQKDSSSTLSP